MQDTFSALSNLRPKVKRMGNKATKQTGAGGTAPADEHSIIQKGLNYLSHQILGLSIFGSMVDQTYEKFDYNKDGKISTVELHVALVLFYDQLNQRLPCHLPPPSHEEVKNLMLEFDVDKSGYIERDEFESLVRALVGTKRVWYDSLIVRVLGSIAVRMLLIPSVVLFLYNAMQRVGISIFGMDAAIFTAVLLMAFNGIGGETKSIQKVREVIDMYAIPYISQQAQSFKSE
eukprot:TRINITY_DN583_c0_g1_i1.p2 TRINITY_DN583_c0_g1~~TRINITY_DN583_c0_g1_i1.p2  ORF type:complete len:231 (+),score=20.47 TRINITY_DN583_c0_g1_i1:103-795(+)